MSGLIGKSSAAIFEALYRADPDPWRFASSSYEQDRYAALLRALRRDYYEYAFEPGCSIGEFTVLLAPRCARLLATDVSATAVGAARARCRSLTQVKIEEADLQFIGEPRARFDLIVLSEIGYYFPADQLSQIATGLANQLLPGGEFLAAHWLGHSADHVLHGDEVHATLVECMPLAQYHAERHAQYRINSWIR
jgi:trans-aconitate methyltransferase